MKRDLIIIGLCFLASAVGANVQPLLSGSGKLIFPENATSAYLQAASGKLTMAAGGSNQNIVLAPSGTGKVAIGTSNPPLLSASSGSLTAAAAGSNQNINLTPSGTGYVYVAGGGGNPRLLLDNSAIITQANVAGTPVNLLTHYSDDKVYLDNPDGDIVFRPLATTTATGDLNATGVFRKAGTAGISATATVRNAAGAGTCTITISGGIITATTC